jgi:hypothetical protein
VNVAAVAQAAMRGAVQGAQVAGVNVAAIVQAASSGAVQGAQAAGVSAAVVQTVQTAAAGAGPVGAVVAPPAAVAAAPDLDESALNLAVIQAAELGASTAVINAVIDTGTTDVSLVTDLVNTGTSAESIAESVASPSGS